MKLVTQIRNYAMFAHVKEMISQKNEELRRDMGVRLVVLSAKSWLKTYFKVKSI